MDHEQHEPREGEHIASVVLAEGLDRWEKTPTGSYRLRSEGDLWVVVTDPQQRSRAMLKPEVAEWCWENIAAYRIGQRFPTTQVGPQSEDAWIMEFRSEADATHFKLRWM
jgi:hypothetical protein